MTNSFKFTPPSNSPTKTAADFALRGNMGSASFLDRACGGGKPWSRQDAIRSAKSARPEVVKKYAPRVANVRRIPSISGFHVIGMGQLAHLTLGELKVKLGSHGYTSYRVGGLKFNLFC